MSFPKAWWGEVIPWGTQISWLGTTSHNFLLNVQKKKKSFPCVAKNATGQRRYCHAVVSSWAIKYFDFRKLAGLWLASLIKNHVRIYGSNVAEGFSAFQRRSCLFCTYSLLSLHCVPWQRLQCGIRDHSGYGLSRVSTQKHRPYSRQVTEQLPLLGSFHSYQPAYLKASNAATSEIYYLF